MSSNTIRPWEVISGDEVYVARPWIKVLKQQVLLPDGRVIDDYHQIQLSDCIVIFAETADGRVIVERSYRHGVGGVSLVMPAGLIEKGETPLDAARRELLEETGYTSNEWEALGAYVIHGSYGCGWSHIFHAREARLTAEPNSDDLEDMEILLMPLPALIDALSTDQVSTMGTMATIALATNPLIRSRNESNMALREKSL